MMSGKPGIKDYLIIILSSILLLVPFLGRVHLFDWDEINFAECAREMIATKNYFSVMINFQPFWEKPPLFIWMQAASMNAFGINEFAARLPDAICGVITFLILFNIGTKLYDKKFGWLWVLSYAAALLPHFYFQSGIIDPWFNLFIFISIYYFILLTNNPSKVNKITHELIFSAIFAGLAILTKGPAAFLIIALCIFVFGIIERSFSFLTLKQATVFIFIIAFTGGLWFLIEIATGHTDTIVDFFNYQLRLFKTEDSGHGGPFYYHFLVLLIGCFPASIFAIRGFSKKAYDTPYQRYFLLWMKILFWVVLILFSIVKTKIVHYSSLCYFPITMLSAYTIHKILNNEIEWKKWMTGLIVIIGSLLGVLITAAALIEFYKNGIIQSGMIHDSFALENLKAKVEWGRFDFLIGIFMLSIVIYFVFHIKRRHLKLAILSLFIGSILLTTLISIFIVPKVEPYSQGAAIEFYKYLKGKDVYVETLGFKSYAHLFYSDKQPQSNIKSYDQKWLLTGNIDKPAYFVSKIDHWKEVRKEYPALIEIYRKNGFVFSKRPVNSLRQE